jgi:hypothetical protein
MSVVQACAQAEAVIQRARSLFATAAVAPADSAADRLGAASQTTAATAQMTGDNSGVLIKRHTAFADKNAVALSGAGHTDAALDAHAARAATLTQTGAQRLDAIAAQTRATTQAATTARTPAAQRVILTAVRSQVAQAQNVVNTTTTQASGLAGQVRALKYPPPAGGHGDTQALGFGPGGTPQTPADKEPPHGKDPRYWIDVGKIIYVPDGKLAPANTVQIGPNMYYPAPYIPDAVVPPPDPVKHPLDIPDVRTVGPDQLLPPGYRLVAPGIGLPDPDAYFQPQPPWTPKQPVDVRDVIQVPADQLAPWGYVEYLPGWWAPGSQLTNTPLLSRCNED